MVDYNIEGIWRGIKKRCGNPRCGEYANCTICDEWESDYNAFANWFIDNLYDCGKTQLQIDKDLFSKGKKIYSPETCCFLPPSINSVLAYNHKKDKELPRGVYKTDNGKYYAIIHHGSGHLSKSFDSVVEAEKFYNSNKERYIRQLADYYIKYLPSNIYNALIRYKCKQ